MKRQRVYSDDGAEFQRLEAVAHHIDHAEPLPEPDLGLPTGKFARAIDVLHKVCTGPTATAGLA